MSKGSKPRPLSIAREEFANRYDNIFRKPKIATLTKPLEQANEQPEKHSKTSIPGTFIK